MSPRPLVAAVLALTLCAGVRAAQSERGEAVELLKPATWAQIERDGQSLRFATAREALAAARAGDQIVLGPGTHYGPLALSTSGVTLYGMSWARVTANSESWKPQWQKEPEYGPFAYSAPIPFEPTTMCINQRVMINVQEGRGGPGVHAKGYGRSGRVPLQGMFTYLSKSKRVVVSFAQELDPTKHVIEAAPAMAALRVRDADNCTVKGLIATGGSAGISLTGTKNTTVEKCLVYGADTGVRLGKGASGCKVLSCDITWNADAIGRDCDPPTVPRDVWMTHKQSGTYDKHGIFIEEAGDNNEVASNYIYDVWDGIEAGNGVGKDQIESHYKSNVFKGISRVNRGLKVHHNRIDLAMDDAMRPGAELVDNEWYSNIVTRAGCATRISTVEMGPFFFYDNLLLDCGDGMRLYKSMPESASVFIFNNAIKHANGIIYHQMDSAAWNNPWLIKTMAKGTPGFRIYNNLFLCNNAFAAVEGDVAPNFKGDCNVYTAPADQKLTSRGIDTHSLFNATPQLVDEATGNYRLANGSAGKGVGCDLAKLGLKTKLPPTLAAAAAGKQPDAGLLGIEPQKTPHGPVSGLWEVAQKQLGLGERDATSFTLPPVRWLVIKQAVFVLRDLPEQDELEVACDRSSSGAQYKVTITNDKGEVLATRTGKSLAEKEGFVVRVPIKGAKELRVAVDDGGSESRWNIQAGSSSVYVDAGKGVGLTKGDAGRFIFDYPVSRGTDSFTLTLHSKYSGSMLEVARPGGKPEPVEKTATVRTGGVAGVYQILVTFTKGAELKVEAPQTLLAISKTQETAPLKKQWGKPAF